MVDKTGFGVLEYITKSLDFLQQILGRAGIELTFSEIQFSLMAITIPIIWIVIVKVKMPTKFLILVILVLLIGFITAHWLSPPGRLDPKLANELEKYKRKNSRSLYLIPYDLHGYNKRNFESHIHRTLLTHLSTINLENSNSDVGIVPLEEGNEIKKLTSTDIELLREMGNFLAALGILSVKSEINDTMEEDKALTISSLYIIIPSLTDFQAKPIYIDDIQPFSSRSKTRIWNDAWKHNTVLALAIKEYSIAKKNNNINSMRVIRNYLRREKRSLKQGQDTLHGIFTNIVNKLSEEIGE